MLSRKAGLLVDGLHWEGVKNKGIEGVKMVLNEWVNMILNEWVKNERVN